MYIFTYLHRHKHAYTHTYGHTNRHAHSHTHTHAHVRTHTHTHIHVHICVCVFCTVANSCETETARLRPKKSPHIPENTDTYVRDRAPWICANTSPRELQTPLYTAERTHAYLPKRAYIYTPSTFFEESRNNSSKDTYIPQRICTRPYTSMIS